MSSSGVNYKIHSLLNTVLVNVRFPALDQIQEIDGFGSGTRIQNLGSGVTIAYIRLKLLENVAL